MLNVEQESCDYQFFGFWFDPTGNQTKSTTSVTDALLTKNNWRGCQEQVFLLLQTTLIFHSQIELHFFYVNNF